MITLRNRLHRAMLVGGLAIGLIGLPGVIIAQEGTANPDLTRQQVATFDQFLDSHPGIARDLQQNPSLVNNQEFMENHPELQTFLSNHAEMREELKENPGLFMRRERGFVASENGMRNGNPELSNQQLATFDRFLDHHKGIAKDLEQNPSLVNDQKFVNQHKDLRAFLKNHPEVSEEFKQNPSLVMGQETRFQQRDRDNRSHRDRDQKDKDKAKHKSKLEQKGSVEPRHLH